MPLVLSKNIMGAELILWQMTETEEELAALVSPDDAASVISFTSAARRCERLAWRAALRGAGIVDKVVYSDEGAPFLEGSDKYISVSHCAGMVCVALSPDRCGVDIEQAGRDCSRTAHRFMSDTETLLFCGQPDAQVVVWCSKEALYKYSAHSGLDFIADIRLVGKAGDVLQAEVAGECATVCILREQGCVIAFAVGVASR